MRRTIFLAAAAIAFPSASCVLSASSSRVNPVHEVHVLAKQYAFEPAVIQVTEGEPVRLVIRSADRGHGFAISNLKIDVRVPASGNAVVEFTAPATGRYEISCSEFCGFGHGRMKAELVSTAAAPPPDR